MSDKKWLLLGLLLIAASWIGNLLYYQSMQLKEPVFLRHYSELDAAAHEFVTLLYLENNHAKKKVTNIIIEEMPQLRFDMHEWRRYTHQTLMRATAEFDPEYVRDKQKDRITVRELTVLYSDGTSKTVPIGELAFDFHERSRVLSSLSSGSSSSGSGFITARAEQELALLAIDCSFQDKMAPLLEISLNDQPIESMQVPLTFAKGDSFAIRYQWKIPATGSARYEVFYPKLKLTFQAQDGEIIYDYMILNYNYYLNEKQLRAFVRAGGEVY